MSNLTPAERLAIARGLEPELGPAFLPVALAIAEVVAGVLAARLAAVEPERAAGGRARAVAGRDLPPAGGERESLADDVWMTTAQVVAYSKRAEVTVHRHAAAGTLKSASGGRGRRRLYRRDWVDVWIENSPRRPPAQPQRG